MFMLNRRLRPSLLTSSRCAFSSSSTAFQGLAICYSQNGNPEEVLRALPLPKLPEPGPGIVNLKMLFSPVNPADINVIEGVYPAKPSPSEFIAQTGENEEPIFVAGNEGVAEITAVGSNVNMKVGDRVIMGKPQSGTWITRKAMKEEDVLRVPKPAGSALTDVHLATLTVNPPTAWNMLRNFVDLLEGDWVIQNGGNSAVGQAVVQIAASRGLNTLNFVRNREEIEELKNQLHNLGATRVATYDDLLDNSFRKKVLDWTQGKQIRLGLNCIGGKETSLMARLLGKDAHLVSYGAMSKQPLSLPTSLFIFKNLTTHGFWQHKWYEDNGRQQRQQLIDELVKLIENGKLKEPDHVIIPVHSGVDQASTTVSNTIRSSGGKKVILKFA